MIWDFNVVRWREDAGGETFWLAALTEKHIVAQARTFDDLDYELKRILAVQVLAHREQELSGDPFERLPPPPEDIRSRPDPKPLTLTADGTHLRFDDGDSFTQVV